MDATFNSVILTTHQIEKTSESYSILYKNRKTLWIIIQKLRV